MFFLHTQNICYYRQLFKYIIDRSYSLNPLCVKFILNKRVIKKSEFEFLRFYCKYFTQV